VDDPAKEIRDLARRAMNHAVDLERIDRARIAPDKRFAYMLQQLPQLPLVI
jgi:hypothetical protein